ncbi:MAG TPA: hypothetical protein VLA05_12735 [Coriobacteriia bacterium]|nr:hypothetical protein [Coriobacteriia bacterium]
MRSLVTTYARRHPVNSSVLLLVMLCAALALGIYALDVARWWVFNQRLEALTEAPTAGVPQLRQWRVFYGGSLYRVSVHVYPSELEAARGLNTAWVFESPAPVRARYVRSLVRAESKTRLAAELTAQLRQIARRAGLSDDEYAELLARAIQDIDYGVIGSEIGMPAEVIAGGKGVCTEKSVLLGALMLREGYDTAMLVLDSHNHVAVGIRSEGPQFRSIPYAFVETTRTARIGEVNSDYLGWGPVGRPPQTITLGGTKRYRGTSSRADSGGRPAEDQTSVMWTSSKGLLRSRGPS